MRLFWLVAAATALADTLSKLWATAALQQHAVQLGSLVHFRLMHNTGMALGILSGVRWAGLILPIIVVACGWLILRRYRRTGFTLTASALIVGGFASNYIQRLFQGYVTDMIYFPWMPWYVCNVADIAICGGVAMLALSLLVRPQDWQELRKDEEACK